jgi:hypothetical protein
MKFALLASLEDRSRSSFFLIAGRLRRASVFLLAALPAAVAQPSAPSQPQSPPAACSAPEYHAFDFWIGDWDVFDAATHQLTAHARISSVESGCALREEYRALDGSGGQSLSAWDAAQRVWRQHWISSRGAIVSLTGSLVGSSMILAGPESGTHAPDLVRGGWTPEPGGVREVGERSIDGGHSWQPWFDLHFRSAGSGLPHP